jgi:hypothetical protein
VGGWVDENVPSLLHGTGTEGFDADKVAEIVLPKRISHGWQEGARKFG